jgi:signal transduction histidine kinase
VIVESVVGARSNLLLGRPMVVSEKSPWSELRAGQPIMARFGDPGLLNLHDEDLIASEGIQSVLVAPLLRGVYILGLVEVMRREPQSFRPADGRLLARLANQVVIAIENAQLYRQLHYLVALEERDRLARELHDHLSQGLAYLKIKAGMTEDLLAGGQIEAVQESLLELKKAAQILYTDVREEIFSLRTTITEREDLFSTLRDYLVDYRTHYGLNVNMEIENECPSEFSPEVASQVLRIVQEALTNVRRHSDAAKVLIHCTRGGEQVCIRIEDDGRGFYPAGIAREGGQRYGLQIMRERAESVGGSLELDSKPGQGTRVILWVPSIYKGGNS